MADIFTNRGVRATARFDGEDAFPRERIITDQEFGVFLGENIVRHHTQGILLAKSPTERQEERRFSAADRAPDPDRERTLAVVTVSRSVSVVKKTWVRPMFMRVSVFVARAMSMAMVLTGRWGLKRTELNFTHGIS
jgi:hypothetical protein